MTVKGVKIMLTLATDKRIWKIVLVILILPILFFVLLIGACTSLLTFQTATTEAVGNLYDALAEKVDDINKNIEDGKPKIDATLYATCITYYISSDYEFYAMDKIDQTKSYEEKSDDMLKIIADDFLLCFYETKANETNSSSSSETEASSSAEEKNPDTEYMAYTDTNKIFDKIEKVIDAELTDEVRTAIVTQASDLKETLENNETSKSEVTESDTGEQKNPE